MAYVSAGGLVNGGSSTFVETFVDTTDYTSGTTTQLTLANTPASENTVWIMFDGLVQHHSEYSISGNVITFTSAIPTDTAEVEVQNNTQLNLAVPGDGTITTDKLVDSAVSYDKLADGVHTSMSSKNVIINGNFDVWQRGTHFPTASSGSYTTDRFKYGKAGAMVHTVGKSGVIPTYAESGTKSNSSLYAQVTTADASLATTDYATLSYNVEGYDYARIAGGDATLSFWVRTSKTGVHCVGFRNNGNDRAYVMEYTIATADTWQKVILTVPLTETGGTWDYTNGVGMDIRFALAAGTNFHTTKDAWQTGNYFATANQVNECDTVDNWFRISQVQLEKGSTATDFEYRSIAVELAECQRYYEKSYDLDVDPGSNSLLGVMSNSGEATTSWLKLGTMGFKVRKRGTPSLEVYNPITGTVDQARNNTLDTNIAAYVTRSGQSGVNIGINNTSVAASQECTVHWTADAEL